MAKKIYPTSLLMWLFLMLHANAFSQTVVNYQTWSAPTLCNIFGSTINVNNIPHATTIGQPRYNTINNAITLECTTTGGNKGTAYMMTYPFKQGFSYQIAVKAINLKSNASDGSSYLRLNLSNGGTGFNSLCTGMQTIDANPSGGLKRSNIITPSNYIDYYFDYTPLSANYAYLLVEAIPFPAAGLQTIYIRTITITETAVSADLTLSPTTINTSCGNTLSQTFTVSNPNNVPNITSYEWNLGASNGWIYNGTAAPATITTTGNSINLSTNCLAANPGNVTVTVHRNNAPYKTYTATVNYNSTINPPQVTGSLFLCTTGTYVASPLPSCGAGTTFTWTKSSNLTLSGTSGNTVNATPVPGASGAGWIEVTASSSCGTATRRVNLTIGVPAQLTGEVTTLFDPTQTCFSSTGYYTFIIVPGGPDPGVDGIYWGYYDTNTGSMSSPIQSTVNQSFDVTFHYPGSYTVFAQALNDCGGGAVLMKHIVVSNDCNGPGFSIAVGPNPTSDQLIVDISNESAAVKKIGKSEQVQFDLYDFNTMVRKKTWKYDNRQNRYTFSLKGVEKGMYILTVTKGTFRTSKKIIVH